MADITPVLQVSTPSTAASTYLWETLTNTNTAGTAIQPTAMEGRFATLTVTGTPDGATTVLQGSNDGTNWFTVLDRFGNAVSFATTTGYAEVSTAFKYLRPSTSGGGASQDLDVLLVLRGRIDV